MRQKTRDTQQIENPRIQSIPFHYHIIPHDIITLERKCAHMHAMIYVGKSEDMFAE